MLKEGTHRINPFIYSVTVVNTRRQRHEFSGKEAITFLTVDGFPVAIEGTVEFNIDEKLAPRLTQVVGDMEDILNKIILPSVRGFARIEGSKKQATEFIVGESRRLFQEKLDAFLKNNCRKWGIEINSVLIRDIIAPQTIAGIIRNRELAHQEAVKYDQEIIRARSEAELAKQFMAFLYSDTAANLAKEMLGKTAPESGITAIAPVFMVKSAENETLSDEFCALVVDIFKSNIKASELGEKMIEYIKEY